MVDPMISIDEYMPKVGHEFKIIVVGFHVLEESAAEDIRAFVERGTAVLQDIEVSPNPNPDGKWLVFVELLRDNEFWAKMEYITSEIERLVGHSVDWMVSTYKQKSLLTMEEAMDVIPLKPSGYALQRMNKKNIKEDTKTIEQYLNEFLADSTINNYNIYRNILTFEGHSSSLCFKVIDYGKEAPLMEKVDLLGVDLDFVPREARVLDKWLGQSYTVMVERNLVYVSNDVNKEMIILDRYV
jgi:hypothetical protein